MNFLDRCSRNTQISNFMKILPVGAELFHANRRTDRQTDGRIDMAKPIVAFRNFPNAPKKRRLIHNHITRKFTLSLIYLTLSLIYLILSLIYLTLSLIYLTLSLIYLCRRDTFRHNAPYTIVRFLNNFPEVITPY
jgi:hypothetical protein